MNINHDISSSLQKIKTDWERSGQGRKGISRIDKDILIQDLRMLYDLVFELEITPANTVKIVDKSSPKVESHKPVLEKTPIRQDQVQEGLPTQQNTKDKINDIGQDVELSQKPEEVEFEIVENDTPGNIEEHEVFTGEIDGKLTDSKKTPTNRETTNETPNHNPVEESVETRAGEKITSNSKPAKSTSEKFHAPKTFADIYQNNGDNSLATKIQKNSITDIKAAIGINDKFLFINEIFKGNSPAYHQAIDKLNNFVHFYEALAFIENIKEENKIGNSEAATSLIEIIKRKFQ